MCLPSNLMVRFLANSSSTCVWSKDFGALSASPVWTGRSYWWSDWLCWRWRPGTETEIPYTDHIVVPGLGMDQHVDRVQPTLCDCWTDLQESAWLFIYLSWTQNLLLAIETHPSKKKIFIIERNAQSWEAVYKKHNEKLRLILTTDFRYNSHFFTAATFQSPAGSFGSAAWSESPRSESRWKPNVYNPH